MSNTWIFSDTHHSHTNICGPSVSSWSKGYRNFDSVAQMNEAIVSSINDVVKEDDILYHLGDWSFGGKDNIKKFRDLIKCNNIVLLIGNHDHHISKNPEFQKLFSEVHELLRRKIAGHYFTLCHYAMRVWDSSHQGALHCFGHSHGSLPGFGRSMDVGWCIHRRPLHIEEVIKELMSKPIGFVDHHNKDTN